MESGAELVVSGPGVEPRRISLSSERAGVGRLAGDNDIALEPDPERLVSRVGHCTFERDGSRWFVVDGGSVNGTYLRRGGGSRERVNGRAALSDGDVVSVLASVERGDRQYFELAFHASRDSQATRAAAIAGETADAVCVRYDAAAARLTLVRRDDESEIPIRAQAHRLVRYMGERNAAADGTPVLCTHDELMRAVWGGEPMHTREELAKIVWELRKKLEPFGAEDAIENERGLGYRLRTCR
jgi:hypothetical protein